MIIRAMDDILLKLSNNNVDIINNINLQFTNCIILDSDCLRYISRETYTLLFSLRPFSWNWNKKHVNGQIFFIKYLFYQICRRENLLILNNKNNFLLGNPVSFFVYCQDTLLLYAPPPSFSGWFNIRLA